MDSSVLPISSILPGRISLRSSARCSSGMGRPRIRRGSASSSYRSRRALSSDSRLGVADPSTTGTSSSA
ncbi:MAG: hypothetical protein ACYS5V_09595, partial [Planctomycetota bacterium]